MDEKSLSLSIIFSFKLNFDTQIEDDISTSYWQLIKYLEGRGFLISRKKQQKSIERRTYVPG